MARRSSDEGGTSTLFSLSWISDVFLPSAQYNNTKHAASGSVDSMHTLSLPSLYVPLLSTCFTVSPSTKERKHHLFLP